MRKPEFWREYWCRSSELLSCRKGITETTQINSSLRASNCGNSRETKTQSRHSSQSLQSRAARCLYRDRLRRDLKGNNNPSEFNSSATPNTIISSDSALHSFQGARNGRDNTSHIQHVLKLCTLVDSRTLRCCDPSNMSRTKPYRFSNLPPCSGNRQAPRPAEANLAPRCRTQTRTPVLAGRILPAIASLIVPPRSQLLSCASFSPPSDCSLWVSSSRGT